MKAKPLSDAEERVTARVRDGLDELTGLVAELIACDTTARAPEDPARDEVKLQNVLAGRLRDIGAEVELFEPEPIVAGQSPTIPFALDFKGRPQLIARLHGSGGGRSLVLNGHIDAVTPGETSRWASDPLKAEIRDGRLYGRGACDMKGGIADFVFALECLHRQGVQLKGDVVVCTNTDEESSGAGGFALAGRVSGDAGLCAEPTGFDAWIACRGTICFSVTISGRSGHAEMPMPHWRAGGAVNSIDRLEIVLGAVRRLREEWRNRPDHQHPLLAPGDIVPVLVDGGEWIVTYPEKARLTCDAQYLPCHVSAEGYGREVREEITACVDAAAACDPWLAEHPLAYDFFSEVVPAEIPADHPLVAITLAATTDLGREGRVSALNSWHDPASFVRAGTPMFSFGPGGFDSGHAVNEYVPVADLADHCAATALSAMRFCGV